MDKKFQYPQKKEKKTKSYEPKHLWTKHTQQNLKKKTSPWIKDSQDSKKEKPFDHQGKNNDHYDSRENSSFSKEKSPSFFPSSSATSSSTLLSAQGRQKKISYLKDKKKPSSQRWLLRHLNDPFVQKAQLLGYRSRAVFKLEELQETYGFIGEKPRVLDLGAAPGGWSQYVAQHYPKSFVIALDLLPMEPLRGVFFLQGNFLEEETKKNIALICKGQYCWDKNSLGAEEGLKESLLFYGKTKNEIKYMQDNSLILHSPKIDCSINTNTEEIPLLQEEEKFTLVLSDMAPTSTGHRPTDLLCMEALMEDILHVSQWALQKGGHLIFKAYHHPFLQEIKKYFSKVHFVKPKASRAESKEIYVVALHFLPLLSK